MNGKLMGEIFLRLLIFVRFIKYKEEAKIDSCLFNSFVGDRLVTHCIVLTKTLNEWQVNGWDIFKIVDICEIRKV